MWWMLLACTSGTLPTDGTATDTDAPQVSATESDPDTDTDDAPPFSATLTLMEHEDIATVLWAEVVLEHAATDVYVHFETDEVELQTPAQDLDAGAHLIPLFGTPSETDVRARVVATVDGVEQSTTVVAATTGGLPSDLDDAELLSWDEDATDGEPWMLLSVDVGEVNFGGPCYTVIVDRQGRVVWYHLTSQSRLTMFPQVAQSGGHVIIDATTYYVYGSEQPSLTRTTLDMVQYDEEVFPYMGLTFHESPDGTIYYDYAASSYQYYLASRDPGTGKDTLVWDCSTWLEQYQEVSYWSCAANTTRYTPATDTVLYSMFRTSTVAEIDAGTGEVLRHFGQIDDGWSFDPEDSALSLQHWPNYTPEGTLIVSTHAGVSGDEQRIREFSFNEATESLVEVWSWGEGSPYYADYAGEAYRRETGHVIHGLGTDGVLLELADDDIVWAIAWQGELLGHATPIADLYALNAGW